MGCTDHGREAALGRSAPACPPCGHLCFPPEHSWGHCRVETQRRHIIYFRTLQLLDWARREVEVGVCTNTTTTTASDLVSARTQALHAKGRSVSAAVAAHQHAIAAPRSSSVCGLQRR
ncbi:Hypothetical predicted protein [Marmota monax]|uniref:Uncharacterized protein n=1 Tax=Marmota monax TaxID=9995 RepID=A0A5E4BKU0_MARMO|nr:Hypothetical predicted protein [Marmota monax]